MTLTELRAQRDNIAADYAERKAEVELWYADQCTAITEALWNLLDDAPVEAPAVVVAPVSEDKTRQPRNAQKRLAALGLTDNGEEAAAATQPKEMT